MKTKERDGVGSLACNGRLRATRRPFLLKSTESEMKKHDEFVVCMSQPQLSWKSLRRVLYSEDADANAIRVLIAVGGPCNGDVIRYNIKDIARDLHLKRMAVEHALNRLQTRLILCWTYRPQIVEDFI